MKNMKLTNLSLSVLIALGLVACGGSDNKDNAPVDPGTGQTGGNGGDDNKPKTPIIENNGKEVPQDPTRAAPKMQVEPNHVDITATNKQLYIDRQSRDAIAGYNGWVVAQGDPSYTVPADNNDIGINTLSSNTKIVPESDWDGAFSKPAKKNNINKDNSPVNSQGGLAYNPGATKTPDILRNSIYNYFEEQSKQNSLNAQGGIHANPAFSYAKGADGNYYRVIPNNGDTWDKLTANSTFKIVVDDNDSNFGSKYSKGKKIPMSEIVFIPNALALTGNSKAANQGHRPDTNEFSSGFQSGFNVKVAGVNILDPNSLPFFDLNRGEVQYKTFELAGVKYDLIRDFDTNNIPLDLSKVEVKHGIQTHGIKLNYDIINDQSTGTLRDDEVVSRSTEVGAMKLYNLPYSRSSITINQQAVDDANSPNAGPNNLFNLANSRDGHYGAFQVVGFQTNSLPRDGRADYTGKSYGVNSEGDLHLVADFAINRAGIHGVVDNRTTADKTRKLASLTLGQIDLSNSVYEQTASQGMQSTSDAKDGIVSVGGRGVGQWAVALYGPNAEEVGGVIDLDGLDFGDIDGISPDRASVTTAPGGNSNISYSANPDYNNGKNFEVFSGQRGSIIKDSLNSGVGVANP